MRIFTMLILLCILTPVVHSQDFDFEPDPNYSKYLNDGRLMDQPNLITWNPLGLVSGYMSFNYDRKFNHTWSGSLIGELRVLKQSGQIYMLSGSIFEKEMIKSGYGLGAAINWHWKYNAIDRGPAFSLMYRYRRMKSESGLRVGANDYIFRQMYTWLIGSRFGISSSTLLGMTYLKGKDKGVNVNTIDGELGYGAVRFLYGIQINAGVFF